MLKIPVPCNMTLFEREVLINHIKNQINQRKNILIQKQKFLVENERNNDLLKNIKNDYLNHYQFILKEKQDQQHFLNNLNNYINQIIISGKLTEQDLLDSKIEQNNILREINHINQDINTLTKLTN